MEGPTPVSALIHAATLVTAGVYLMLRSAPMLEQASTVLLFTAWLGALTAFYAATCGLLVNDVKRVIAFSTCSQLGYMMMAVGLSQYHVGLFHLMTHACYKSLLFLSAGSVLHAMSDQQDIRRLGGLATLLPFTFTSMLVGSLSLMALPGLTGYYSKDHILELAAGSYTLSGTVVYWAGSAAALMTAFYSYRLLTLVFFASPQSTRMAYGNVHEASVLLGAPLVFLSVLAIGFGYLAKDLYLGMGTDFLSSVTPLNPSHTVLVEAEFALSPTTKLVPLVLTIIGATASYLLYQYGSHISFAFKQTTVGRVLYTFINAQWQWNALVTGAVISPTLGLGHVASKVLDRGVIESVGPHGLSQVIPQAGRQVASFDTSLVTSYAIYTVISFLSLAVILISPASYVTLMLIFLSALIVMPVRQAN
jgi:NADH-ubiquinone oxidoreductase chain 5